MHTGDSPTASTVSWRINRWEPIVKVAFAATFVACASGRQWWWAVTLFAVAAVISAARDVIVPVRVSADHAGVTLVTGFARHERLAWGDIQLIHVREPLSVPNKDRLEIVTGRKRYRFSRFELGAQPTEVAAALIKFRAGG